jgi:hypothetical protein
MNEPDEIVFTSLATGAVVVKHGQEYQVYADDELIGTLRYKDAAVMAAIGFRHQNDIETEEKQHKTA